MKNLLCIILIFSTVSTVCYSQQVHISSSSNKTYKIAKFWIDIEFINNTKDTLFIPKNPTFGLKYEFFDCFVEFLDPKTDTIINIQPKADYNYVIMDEEIEKVKLLPNESYKFDYYLNHIYDLDPNKEYNICLHWQIKDREQEIISNLLLIPAKE